MNYDEIKKHGEKLINAEKQYQSELDRIKKKQEQDEEKRAEKSYRLQLSKARTSTQVEKLKLDRISKLQKESEDAYLKSLKESLAHEEEERDRHFRDIKYQLDTGVISESEYYRQLEILRDAYFEEGTAEWQKYSVQIAKYNHSVAEENKKIIEDILSETAEKVSAVRSEVKENLKDYGTLYNTINAKYKKMGPFGSDLIITKTELADLRAQTETLKEYTSALISVKNRGEIPESLFEELRSLDVESGLRFANALLSASDSEFNEYINAYRDKQEEIANLTEALTADTAEKAILVMKSKLSEVYGEIPEDFFLCGLESAENFAKGFIDVLETELANFKTLIASNMAELVPWGIGQGTQNNNSYTASYNFYGSGESTASQLQAARSAAVIERMRGGYDI